MRLKLGILAPFILQIGITFLYSTIKYDQLEISLLSTVGIYIFPILIIYILAPHVIINFIGMEERISKQINDELDQLVLSDTYGQEEGRTQLLENRFPTIGDVTTISDSIKSKLTPLITKRALNYYKDNYYSRDDDIKQERSLIYYEAMVLFSGLSLIFFIVNLLIVWIISFRSLNVYFIELNLIENNWITFNISVIFIFGIIVTYFLLEYSSKKLMYYLPYSVPVLFNEATEEQYLRRETIRSIIRYNFDNLIDRRDQRAIQKQINKVLSSQLNPLLREEILITARTEFANKFAWREYSKIIESDILSRNRNEQTCLELLTVGEKIGPVQLDQKSLLSLHSDVQYINNARNQWSDLPEETRAFVYFQLYRVVEFIMRQISFSLNYHKDDQDFNLYAAINNFHDEGYLDDDGKNELHNLRYRRNKLMHEIGATLDVSFDSIEKSINAIESILEKIKDDYQT